LRLVRVWLPYGRDRESWLYSAATIHLLEVGSVVTAPQASGAGRVSGATTSSLRLGTAIPALAIILPVALIIRLTLAYVLLPRSGFETDLSSFTAWALHLAENGPGSFYSTAGFADYPPGYLYVLWLIGGLGQVLAPLGNADPTVVTSALIKLPAIFA
jgi:hypothetical protein